MEKNISLLEMSVEEYQVIMANVKPGKKYENEDYWLRVKHRLQTEAGWTRVAAQHISNLAQNYGSFALRNALALAMVLDIEDGAFDL